MSQSKIDEILEALCYKKSENAQPDIDYTGGAASNCCSNLNLDIINGFQDVNPLLFVIVGELIGNILSGEMPFNVANSVSNFLNLVGQIIETYAAQQNYFQDGPGRYYHPMYRNVANPFCSCQSNNVSKTEFFKLKKELDLKLEEINNRLNEYEEN